VQHCGQRGGSRVRTAEPKLTSVAAPAEFSHEKQRVASPKGLPKGFHGTTCTSTKLPREAAAKLNVD
jgi:hypothetical protein